jgi:hypothetical protein
MNVGHVHLESLPRGANGFQSSGNDLTWKSLDPMRFDRATVSWHARFVLEAWGTRLKEATLALAAVQALPGSHAEIAAFTLRRLAARFGLSAVPQSLR